MTSSNDSEKNYTKAKPRTGRLQSRGIRYQTIDDAISKSPNKSARKLSAELEVPCTTLGRKMKVDLKLFPYRPMLVQELSDHDLNRQRDACGRMLQEFRTVSKRRRVIFSDKSAIHRNS